MRKSLMTALAVGAAAGALAVPAGAVAKPIELPPTDCEVHTCADALVHWVTTFEYCFTCD